MKVRGYELDYFLDKNNRRIHIKNTNILGYQNVFDGISPSFQKELIELEGLSIEVLGYEWIIYSSNGFAMVYASYSFQMIGKDQGITHKPFLKASKSV